MANLTDQLPVITQGRPTEAPVRPFNMFESLASGASRIIDAQRTANQTEARRAAGIRQAQADARALADRNAGNAAARALPDILNPGGLSPAVADAQSQIGGLSNLRTAVEQGRQSPQALEIRADMSLRDLIARHPGSEAEVVQFFRENNILSPLMREYNRAVEVQESEEDFLVAEERKNITAAGEIGFAVTPDMSPTDRARAVETGRQYRESQARLAQLQANLQIQQTQQNMTVQQRTEMERNTSTQALQEGLNSSSAQLSGFLAAINTIADNTDASEPENLARIQALVARVEGAANIARQRFVTQFGTSMTNEDLTTFNSQVDSMVSQIRTVVDGPTSIVQRRVQQLRLIETNLGIRTGQALPIFSQVRAMLGNNTATDAFFTSILSNEELMTDVRRELAGYSNMNLSQRESRLRTIAGLVNGSQDLRNLSPAESRQQVGPLTRIMTDLANRPDVRSGSDENAHRNLVTTVGQASLAALDATPQWGVNPLAGAIGRIASQNVAQAMIRAQANPDQRELMAGTWLPAIQRLHNTLRDSRTSDPYYEVYYTGTGYNFRRNNTPDPRQNDMVTARLGRNAPGFANGRQPPTQETLAKVASLNQAIRVLVDASNVGMDEAMPRNIPSRQRRDFYATGRVPAQMITERANNRPQVQSFDQNLTNLEQQADRLFDSFVTPAQGTAPVPGGDLTSAIEGAENSTGNPGARNPNSSATGNGQFIESTWLDVTGRHAAGEIAGKSRAEILAMRSDPAFSRRMTTAYLSDLGRELNTTNPADLSLAYFTGPAGFRAVQRAAPNTPVAQVLDADAVRANPFLRNWTVQQLREWAARRIQRNG